MASAVPTTATVESTAATVEATAATVESAAPHTAEAPATRCCVRRPGSSSCPMVETRISSEAVASDVPVDCVSADVTIDDGGAGGIRTVIKPDVMMSPIGTPVIPAPTPVSEGANADAGEKSDPARSDENTLGRIEVVSRPHAERSAVNRPRIVSRHVDHLRIRRFHDDGLALRGYLLI